MIWPGSGINGEILSLAEPRVACNAYVDVMYSFARLRLLGDQCFRRIAAAVSQAMIRKSTERSSNNAVTLVLGRICWRIVGSCS